MHAPAPAIPRLAWHTVVLAVALVLPTLATWIYFVLFDGREEALWIYSCSKVLQFALPVLWLAACEQRGVRELFESGWPLSGSRVERRRGLVVGAAFGAVIAAAICGLYFGWLTNTELFARVAERVRIKLSDLGAGSPARFVALALFLAVLHSGLEEYYWRWFVCGQLQRRVVPPVAIAVSSLGFMAHHVIVLGTFFEWAWLPTAFFSLSIAVGGAVWAWLYLHTRSLAGAWISHLLVDTAVMGVGYALAFQ